MIIGTGVDIVKTERFKKAVLPLSEGSEGGASPRFLVRAFSPREQAYLSAKGPQSMAGLFAAKEAVVKALGTGFAGFFPCDVEILRGISGKPYVVLHGKAKEVLKKLVLVPYPLRRRCFSISVSISHSETDAIAFAVLERV